MNKLFDLKHWAFVLILSFAAKLMWLTMTTWLDYACLAIALAAYIWAYNKEEAKKLAPKMEAHKEITRVDSVLLDLDKKVYEMSAEMAELKKVTEEAKKLISQTNITAAFVPRRARGE